MCIHIYIYIYIYIYMYMYTCIHTYLFDLEACRRPVCYTLAACNMIAAVISMLCKIWDTSQASSDDLETSEQIQFGDECKLRSSRDPVGYSRDPKHHGQAMRSAMKAEWVNSQIVKWIACGSQTSFRKYFVHYRDSPH